MDQIDQLLAQAERVRASQVLGRSRLINRLFDYLVECGKTGRIPKEIEVAIDAFGRGNRFDASQDAIVRVCVHKLRRKLEEFYAGPGSLEPARITVARGEYRLLVEPLPDALTTAVDPAQEAAETKAEIASPNAPLRRRLSVSPRVILAGLAISLVANLVLWAAGQPPAAGAERRLDDVRTSKIWSPLFDDELPIHVVVGDYYVFGEVDEFLNVQRLIRDFGINSREDLEQSGQQDAVTSLHFQDLNLDYIPTASAFALREIMPVLAAANRRVHLTVMSEFDPSLLKSAHVVYIGYLSGLGMLHELVFSGSRLKGGESFDELIDTRSGTHYVSDVGGPVQGRLRYRDYGYFSTFPGPAGNQLIFIAGTRDTAVMQTAEMIADPVRIEEAQEQVSAPQAMEALYEVYAFENTNIDAQLVLAADLDTSGIWSVSR